MRIEGNSIIGLVPKRSETRASAADTRETAEQRAVVVKLGDAARSRGKGGAEAEMRARIVALRTQIAEGSYQPDLGRVAEAIVGDEIARGGGDQ